MKKATLTLLVSVLAFSLQSQVTCTAGFTYNSAGTQFNFNGTVTSSFQLPVSSWRWTFGDGTTDSVQNPVHTFAKDSTYTVCLMVTLSFNACTDSVCKTVVVNSSNCGSANFIYKVTGNNVGFTDKSLMSSPVTSWSWDFGDGITSTAQNPVHVYAQPGQSYFACLTASDGLGCTKTFCDSVRIPAANCIADFTVTVTGDSVVVTDITQINGGPGVPMRTWDFGDGTVIGFGGGANPGHKYAATGTYMICLTVNNLTVSDCSDSVCKPVYVTVGIPEEKALIRSVELFPNPAGKALNLEFYLDKNSAVNAEIYNMLGNKVTEPMKNQNLRAGNHKTLLDVEDIPAGVYFVHVKVSGYHVVKRLVISR